MHAILLAKSLVHLVVYKSKHGSSLNEAPLRYLMLGAFPMTMSECLFCVFNKQQVSELIYQFEMLVNTCKSFI